MPVPRSHKALLGNLGTRSSASQSCIFNFCTCYLPDNSSFETVKHTMSHSVLDMPRCFISTHSPPSFLQSQYTASLCLDLIPSVFHSQRAQQSHLKCVFSVTELHLLQILLADFRASLCDSQSMGSEARLPGFESLLFQLLAVSLGNLLNLSVPHFPNRNKITVLQRLLGVSKLMHCGAPSRDKCHKMLLVSSIY